MNHDHTLSGPYGVDEHLVIAVASFTFLGIGFLLDIATTQGLVVAILYNVPIAFSGLSSSKRLIYSVIVFALLMNLVAGYLNMLALGGFDAVAILNRFIAGLSFLLVGFMTRALRRASSRLAALKLSEKEAAREHKVHRLTTEIGGALHPQAFLKRTCEVLRELLDAKAVVITASARNRFAAPQFSDPAHAFLTHAPVGERVPWLVAVVPTNGPPIAAGRVDGHPLAVGLLHHPEGQNLIVMVVEVKADDAMPFLAEALHNLEPLWERALLVGDLDRQRAELERRNGVIRDLVYAFSHDLRTPLIANAMNMRLALEGAFGELSPEYQRTLKNGLSANEDLLELADSLLLVARHESGERLEKPEPTNLTDLLNQALARLEPVLDEKQIRVKVEAPKDLKVLGRPAELRRVLQNLLDNAAKFSPRDSVVEVRLYFDETYTNAPGARLEVLDPGPGVQPHMRERLFQRFSHGRAGGGSGLGLYLARQIVTEHGGEIGYNPREEGGSRFTVWLPVAKEVTVA